MIIVRCLKNFFKGLGYYFTPLGVIALCLILAMTIAIPHMINTVRAAFDQIAAKLQSVSYDWESAQQFIIGKALGTDWGNIQSVISPEWGMGILKEAIAATFHTETLTTEVEEIVKETITSLSFDLVGILISIIVGFVLGFIILRVQMRKRITEASFVRVLLVSILDAFVVGGFIVLINFIIDKSHVGGIFAIIIGVAIFLLGSIIEAYLFYGIKRAKLKQVFSPKSVLFLIIGDILVVGITAGIGIGFYFWLNMIAFVTVFLPMVEVSLCVITINAEGMVMDFVRENKLEKKINKKVEERINTEQ